MGTPIAILTGGDPLQREDLDDLIRHGKSIGLRMGTIPAETPRLTRDRVFALKAAGLDQMALSLDGSTAALHDGFRQVDGCYDLALSAAEWAREAGLPLQINTAFCAWNFEDFDTLAALVARLGVVFWEVFFLVPTGRGAELQGCSAEQYEILFGKLHALAAKAPYIVKITEAPHYRRYILQQEGAGSDVAAHRGQRLLARPDGPRRTMGLSPLPVNAGKGFCFVDHVGEIFPSGFLPLSAGNVRRDDLAEVYRTGDLFLALRDPSRLKGRCGICEYRDVCGGSRSRAYALTGDPFEEDAGCAYQPAARA
jgi:radical SAM protein with 4Fe4S-binding SPASM domain